VFSFQQAGLVLYEGDDAFVKLSHVSSFETRQTEWAKETRQPLIPRGQRYGNTVVGPPGLPGGPRTTTLLRIVRRGQLYTAYTSIDGRRWVRGGTWTHELRKPRLGLVSMGGAGHTADFDYVRVYSLRDGRRHGKPFAEARPHRVGGSARGERPPRVREQLPPRR
jgi:arabinan endo-1,5-alpha-L-arabinosidase